MTERGRYVHRSASALATSGAALPAAGAGEAAGAGSLSGNIECVNGSFKRGRKDGLGRKHGAYGAESYPDPSTFEPGSNSGTRNSPADGRRKDPTGEPLQGRAGRGQREPAWRAPGVDDLAGCLRSGEHMLTGSPLGKSPILFVSRCREYIEGAKVNNVCRAVIAVALLAIPVHVLAQEPTTQVRPDVAAPRPIDPSVGRWVGDWQCSWVCRNYGSMEMYVDVNGDQVTGRVISTAQFKTDCSL